MIRMIAVLPVLALVAAQAHAQTAVPALGPAQALGTAGASGAPAHVDDAWTATRGLAPGDVLRAEDVEIRPLPYQLSGGFSLDHSPAGLEVKHRVMAGRPLLDRDVGRHAVIHANTPVHVLWQSGGISMELEARSLQDGAPGDDIRVLNTASARTLHGVVLPDGSVQVGGGE